MSPPSIRHRPPRLGRIFQGVRGLYFVTFNTHGRKNMLANEPIHVTFRTFCNRAVDHGISVGRYVIMPDHVHLFVAMPEVGPSLANWVQSLRATLGKTLLDTGHPKPHWQEGFFDHLLRSHESYSEKWEYVRMNPVRAGLTKNPDQWPFSGEIGLIRY